MSLVNAQHSIPAARCSQCDHDLAVKAQRPNPDKPDPRVYCTNPKCKFSKQAYPMGKELEEGKVKMA